jgi:hypothetical protein
MVQNPSWQADSSSRSQEIPRNFYENRRFVAVFKTARHLHLPWARRIQYTSSNPISLKIHFNIIVQLSFKFAL